MKGSSQNYDGGVAPRRGGLPKLVLNGRPPAVPAKRLPKSTAHGIGAQTSRCYCSCGGKLKDGKCVRGCDG